MLNFSPNTDWLEYQDGGYLCNGRDRVEAPLTLETLAEAVRSCPKLQQVGLDGAPFGDPCFPILAQIPRLKTLSLLRGEQITGHGLALLKDLPLKQLFLQRTALDDEGLAQAAQIKKLETVYIAACPHVTFEGLMAVHWRDGLHISDSDQHDEQGRAGLFTQEQRKAFEDARTYKCVKEPLPLDAPELEEPICALREFFSDMTRWEKLAEQKGMDSPGIQADINALFARRVSWKPRPGWRPVHLSWSAGGSYTNYRLTMGERVTKNKYWLYAENEPLCRYHRFLLRWTDGSWMIDHSQECRLGQWKFCGL